LSTYIILFQLPSFLLILGDQHFLFMKFTLLTSVRSPAASPVFGRGRGVTRSYAWDALPPYKKGFHLGFHNSLSFSTSTDRQLQQAKKNFEELHRKFSIIRMKVFGTLAVVAITLQLSVSSCNQ
jgi:hypothetical protein